MTCKKGLILMYMALLVGSAGSLAYAQGMGGMGGGATGMMGTGWDSATGAGPNGTMMGSDVNVTMGPGGTGTMGDGWQIHGTTMMDFGSMGMNANPNGLGVFPDGSRMYVMMPDQFDGYHHVVINVNDRGHMSAMILQPNGQPGQYWDSQNNAYISHMYLEWMGGNSYRIYTQSPER